MLAGRLGSSILASVFKVGFVARITVGVAIFVIVLVQIIGIYDIIGGNQ